MVTGKDIVDLTGKYYDTFGEYPDDMWRNGLHWEREPYAAMLQKAIADGKPLPDYNKANGMPEGCIA